jgi:hypothetical protein
MRKYILYLFNRFFSKKNKNQIQNQKLPLLNQYPDFNNMKIDEYMFNCY